VTPYYSDEWVTIWHGDCRDVLPTLTADTFITSPPYNLGHVSGAYANMRDGYATHDDAMPDEEYVAWQQSTLSLMWAALPDTGAIFYNHKPLIRDRSAVLPTRLLPAEVTLRQIITWDRGVGMNWSPTHLRPQTEWIMLLAKPGWALPDRGSSTAGDLWRFPIEQTDYGHPCPFPVALPAHILELTSGTVCDPFMGSGTTLVAAKAAGRKAVGIELDERYCEIAVSRLAQGVLWEAS
jgi:DNA modification methylase